MSADALTAHITRRLSAVEPARNKNEDDSKRLSDAIGDLLAIGSRVADEAHA
ncbi:Uu.00g096610.m01.CDS01 [Anthostomella pinea]|uniref:Uu.00g096610.m01.CDS01 n=1 Tax=Anthostomella pinea TaxID=933095 RepID=A0AAI8VCT3_9PEZI|nr:Uu.00g096610.m01.CDS01 [Anthostomella pinea]